MSLRDEIYKTPRPHETEVPRTGDLAEIRRSHCTPESGLLVQVMGKPHFCECFCTDCGQTVREYFIEVHAKHDAWADRPGPWFIPIDWLKRIDPRDPLQYDRVRNYQPLAPTPEQEKAWNPGIIIEPHPIEIPRTQVKLIV